MVRALAPSILTMSNVLEARPDSSPALIFVLTTAYMLKMLASGARDVPLAI